MNLVNLVTNNSTGLTHAVSIHNYKITLCGLKIGPYYDFGSFGRPRGVDCKTCRKIFKAKKVGLGLHICGYAEPNDDDPELLKDVLRLMKKSGGFIKNAPIFGRIEKAIKRKEG